MNFILFDDRFRNHLLPLTFIRPVSQIRCGILTIQEKWAYFLQGEISNFTVPYLRKKFQLKSNHLNLFINGGIFPNSKLVDAIVALQPGNVILSCDGKDVIAFATDANGMKQFSNNKYIDIEHVADFNSSIFYDDYIKIYHPWDVFALNGKAIEMDFELLTHGRKSKELSSTNTVIGSGQLFIEDGVVAECSVFNTTNGPIYLAKGSEVMENCSIRGPFSLGEHSVLKMGAKIYSSTTIGPECKVGGEVNNSVFFGYSNKAHDGFLGNSVIAEWCNLGADTNNSNLKNTYEIVKLWSYPDKQFVSTGLQFCGLIMGDHSKCGINTMFNTGTVVGVSANIFGDGFPRNYIPSFSWGGAAGFKKFQFSKAIEVAQAVYNRRNAILSDFDIEILQSLYEMSEE